MRRPGTYFVTVLSKSTSPILPKTLNYIQYRLLCVPRTSCLFHSLSLPAKHLWPCLLFLIKIATCCLNLKRSCDLGLSNSFLILTFRKCKNYRRQLTLLCDRFIYCPYNKHQTNTQYTYLTQQSKNQCNWSCYKCDGDLSICLKLLQNMLQDVS